MNLSSSKIVISPAECDPHTSHKYVLVQGLLHPVQMFQKSVLPSSHQISSSPPLLVGHPATQLPFPPTQPLCLETVNLLVSQLRSRTKVPSGPPADFFWNPTGLFSLCSCSRSEWEIVHSYC